MKKRRGKFVVLEGGDGAGKDTQAALLQKRYKSRNDVIFTRDPGGTVVAQAIRKLVLANHAQQLTLRAELLLFLSARAQLVEELIAPALAAGKHVICHRYELSTIAYQIFGRERKELRNDLSRFSQFARGRIVPDLYVLLDVPPEVGMRRTREAKGIRRDRFEREALVFYTRVGGAYRSAVKKYPHVVIDANRSVEEVFEDVRAAIDPLLS